MGEERSRRIPQNKLDPEAYCVLEGIVGPERISQDRAIVETYSKFTLDAEGFLKKHQKDGSFIPACVILPQSTEEVQSIVRTLNRYKVAYVPFTNGQSVCNPTLNRPTVCIHLSRMDRIIALDESNRTMTVQPYVDYSMVNVEAMKKGLWNGGTATSGAVCKIASHFAFAGIWHTQLKYCGMSRNVVSVTMVLPTGELLKTGSLTVPNAGDYCEHGPGPNLMGFLRSSMGSLGIVVEITIKLHRWLGEPVLEIPENRPSMVSWSDESYEQVKEPGGYRVLWIEHPDLRSHMEAIYNVCHAGIGIGLSPMRDDDLAKFCSRTAELTVQRQKDKFMPHHIFQLILGALTSKKQLDYEEKVVREILATTGGKLLSPDYKPEVLEAISNFNLDAFRTFYPFRVFRSGMYGMVWIPMANIGFIEKMTEYWSEAQKKFGPKAQEMSMGDVIGFIENMGHTCMYEVDNAPRPTDPEALALCIPMNVYGVAKMIAGKHTGLSTLGLPIEPFTSFFPEVGPQFNLLLRRIREVFDPNGISAPGRQVFTQQELDGLPREVFETLNNVRAMVGLEPVATDTRC